MQVVTCCSTRTQLLGESMPPREMVGEGMPSDCDTAEEGEGTSLAARSWVAVKVNEIELL